MSEDISREKKLIRAPNDLVTKLNKDATNKGKTFYSYISMVLEQAVRAYEMKSNLKEIIDTYELLMVHKEAGTILTPIDVLNYMIDQVKDKNKETLQQLWYQSGKWYGIYFRERFEDSIESFSRLLKNGILDINEVTIKNIHETIEIKCVSAFLSQKRTKLLLNFIEGAIHSLGYNSDVIQSYKGIIRVKCSPKGESR